MTSRRIIRDCQRKLLLVWAVLGSTASIIVLVQTAPGGVYHTNASDVWDWFLPTLIPTLSLMVGTVAAEVRTPDPDATVDDLAYRVALWASVLYLALVIGLLLAYAQSGTPVTDLKGSSKLVSSVYGIVGVTLGTFFVSKRTDKTEAKTEPTGAG